jgi:hypothetical protein
MLNGVDDQSELFGRGEGGDGGADGGGVRAVRLRGSPVPLTAPDWQLVRHWHKQGIPIDLVQRTLEEVVSRCHEGGSPGVISSLRYFAAAVEAAWSRC